MQTTSVRLRPVLIHSAAWLGFIVYELLIGAAVRPVPVSLLETGLSFCLNASLFYVNCLVLMPWLFAHRRYVLYSLLLLGLISTFILLRYTLKVDILPTLGVPVVNPIVSLKTFLGESLYRGGYFLFPSFGYWFAQNALRLEKQKREREHQLRVAEKNLMEANIAFLKNQINPHFLFNSLNFLYAQVYPHSEPAAKGILLLSDIMRYALKEDDNHGKVMLEKEVQHLHNYLALNQLRFNQQLQIQLEIEGSLRFLMILPLVLITFVENCIKHGELSDAQNPLLIQLRTTNNQLYFRTHNKKRQGPKEKSTGIGLVNTRQRLDMAYPGKYDLTVTDADSQYTCVLIIEL
jgi:sensor histidine kinase YesM